MWFIYAKICRSWHHCNVCYICFCDRVNFEVAHFGASRLKGVVGNFIDLSIAELGMLFVHKVHEFYCFSQTLYDSDLRSNNYDFSVYNTLFSDLSVLADNSCSKFIVADSVTWCQHTGVSIIINADTETADMYSYVCKSYCHAIRVVRSSTQLQS